MTQTIEIKADKFLFQLISNDGQIEFAVKGDFKIEKRGPFKTARFFHLKAEPASPDVIDLDDEIRICLHACRGHLDLGLKLRERPTSTFEQVTPAP